MEKNLYDYIHHELKEYHRVARKQILLHYMKHNMFHTLYNNLFLSLFRFTLCLLCSVKRRRVSILIYAVLDLFFRTSVWLETYQKCR